MDKKGSGLTTTKEAQDLLSKYGPNLVAEEKKHKLISLPWPFKSKLNKF